PAQIRRPGLGKEDLDKLHRAVNGYLTADSNVARTLYAFQLAHKAPDPLEEVGRLRDDVRLLRHALTDIRCALDQVRPGGESGTSAHSNGILRFYAEEWGAARR